MPEREILAQTDDIERHRLREIQHQLLAWREVRALADEDGLDPSVRRMAWKWLRRAS